MYLSIYGETFSEKVIEKSRFIAYCAHTEGEGSAKEFLFRIKNEHPLATHICYGYISDKTGNEQRFSDDGEPQGTAGMPILSVLKAQKLFETSIAVVRYFGGIKLGAGGLTRAYASSAAEAVSQADKREYDVCVNTLIRVNYPEVASLTNFLTREGYTDYPRNFTDRAEFEIAVREREAENFFARLQDRLNGKAEIFKRERYYFPFPLK